MGLKKTVSKKISENLKLISEDITNRYFEINYSNRKTKNYNRNKYLKDIEYNLVCLSQSILLSSSELFIEYVVWVKFILESRFIKLEEIIKTLLIIEEVLEKYLTDKEFIEAKKYLTKALTRLNEKIELPTSFLNEKNVYEKEISNFLNLVLSGEKYDASKMILDLIKRKENIKDIYLNIFNTTQYEIGRLWQLNKITVAQEHYATSIIQSIIDQIYPYISSSEKNGKVLISTSISNELHELGIKTVSDFFEMEGWKTFYLGVNTPNESIISTIIEKKADILAVSVSMAYNLKKLEELISEIRKIAYCDEIKILVGGYPFNIDKNLWKKIGADMYASNAQEAILLAEKTFTKI